MITLFLYGELAEEFGDSIKLAASTPREAVLALSYQSEKYKNTILQNDWHVMVGKDNDISEKELDLSLGKVTEVYLIPVIEGSNSSAGWVGAAMVIVGTVLVFTGIGAPLGYGMIGAGVGLMVADMVLAGVEMPDTAVSADSNASFLFTGPSNSNNQGVAIPRGYGRMLVGSTVVSVAINAEEDV